jgi:O-succinylbenzoic acid--CoA ligase
MQGYFEDPRGTDAVLQDGWLRTGDLGRVDVWGRLIVEGRRTDLILSGGENVYPAEIETTLLGHPSVVDVAVLGVESEEWGQVPVAFVVQHGTPVSGSVLESWCRERLAGFKVPREFVELPELPRQVTGKVDRRALEALLSGAGLRE